MSQAVVEKLAQAHLAEGPQRPLRAGDFVSIRPKHVMTHDNTSPVIKKFKAIGAQKVFDPRQPVFALDHDIQNTGEENLKKYRAIEAFAREHGIDFYPAGTGIGHQVMVEKGYVTPGSFVVASDSHSNMYGALGAIGTPVVRTDAAAIWATGEFWWQIPRTVQVVLEGKLPQGATGKDVIIALCGLYNQEEVLNAVVEFAGPGVASLSMDERLTIANMSTEWGTLAGWFPVDSTAITYMRRVHAKLKAQGIERFTEADIVRWEKDPPRPDADAQYSARIVLKLDEVMPHVSGPDTVQVMSSLAEIGPKRIAIQKAYLVSCVNSRLEDLEAAAAVLKGRKIAPSVKFYLAPASMEVQVEAERSGAWKTIVDAGAVTLPAGCGPCIGLGTGLLEPGEVGISATNRNFKGRMGSKEAQCYLASPAVVAASAVAGYTPAPQDLSRDGRQAVSTGIKRNYTEFRAKPAAETVEVLPGFPSEVRGRLVFMPKDNLNTDGIYPGSYTYRDDMTPEMMTKVIFENYDAEYAKKARAGDVVVGGFNFGTGSSREQAVTSLKAAGILLVIAGSFSQTYLRNAFNNGFLCIEVPEFVDKLKKAFAGEKGKTIIPGDELLVDFRSGIVSYRGDRFRFPPLGTVPQSLVVAGGVENLAAKRLGLREPQIATK